MHPNRTVKIIIADDFEIFRCGYKQIIETLEDPLFEIIAEAADGIELIEKVKKLRPDIVITDIKMSVMDGMRACSIIKEKYPRTKLIVFSSFEQGDLLLEMVAVGGANGYLIKHANKYEVLESLKTVSNGLSYYCSATKKRLFEVLQTKNKTAKKVLFSVQEMKVIGLICKQLTTKEIAYILHLGNRSVEDYRHNIQEKIGAKNMVGIAMYALVNELVKVSELDLI